MKIKLINADQFKNMLLTNGFTQRSLANAAGISDTTINHVANGIRHPGPTTAKKICTALGCDFDDIFFIEEDYKSNHKSA